MGQAAEPHTWRRLEDAGDHRDGTSRLRTGMAGVFQFLRVTITDLDPVLPLRSEARTVTLYVPFGAVRVFQYSCWKREKGRNQ